MTLVFVEVKLRIATYSGCLHAITQVIAEYDDYLILLDHQLFMVITPQLVISITSNTP